MLGPSNPLQKSCVSDVQTYGDMRLVWSSVPPFARHEGRTAKTCVQLRFRCQTQPFHTNGGQMQFCNVRREWQKSAIKLRFGNVSCNPLVRNVKLLCVKASLCKSLCVYKLLSVNASVYESCCVKASLCKIFIFSA